MSAKAKVTITKQCPMCGECYDISLTEDQRERYFRSWNREVLIQDALPELNPMEREFLKTGYCPKCQRLLFATKYASRLIRLSR